MTDKERDEALGKQLLPIAQHLLQVTEAMTNPDKIMPALPFRNVRYAIWVGAERMIQMLEREAENKKTERSLLELEKLQESMTYNIQSLMHEVVFPVSQKIEQLGVAIQRLDDAQRRDYRELLKSPPAAVYVDSGDDGQ